MCSLTTRRPSQWALRCRSLRLYARDDKVRALIGKLIIEAAKNGERDPIRIQSQALMESSIDACRCRLLA